MAGHRPFSEVRAKIEADPARAVRLEAAEQQLATEQATYDHLVTDVQRARALGMSPAQIAGIEDSGIL